MILKMAPCARVFGTVVFCKDVTQPNFAFDFKAAKAAKNASASNAKNDAGADNNKKQQKP